MRRGFSSISPWFWCLAAAGCSSEEMAPPPPPPTILAVTVTDATTGAAISGAEVTYVEAGDPLISDASGKVSKEVAAGKIRVRVQAAGYLRGEEQLVTAAAEKTTSADVALDPRPGAVAGGSLRGKVTHMDGTPAADVLVVAASTVRFSALTDAAGRYALLGVAPNLYGVRAYAKGQRSSERTNVQVDVGKETKDVDLTLTPAAGGRVTGMLGMGAGTTSVALALASTGDPIPGLLARATFGAAYAIEGVPDGDFEVRAANEVDGTVIDPDLIREDMLPVAHVANAAAVTVDLPTAPSILGLSPTATTTDARPTFRWAAVPDADFYVIEVRNVAGQVLWGGFDARRNPKLRVLAPDTSVRYGDIAAASEELQPGRRYAWRVYAGVDTTTGTLFELIAASEQGAGSLRVRR